MVENVAHCSLPRGSTVSELTEKASLSPFPKRNLQWKDKKAQMSKLCSTGTGPYGHGIGSWIQISLLAVLPRLNKAGFASHSLCCRVGEVVWGLARGWATKKLGWAPRGYK